MMTDRERFVSIKNVPSDNEVARIHSLLIADTGFFVDRELILLLSHSEVSSILEKPIETSDIGVSTIGDLIRREEVREWSNLPDKILKSKEGEREGISLLSVLEYMLKRSGGIVEGLGKFPSDGNQIALQKEVLGGILAQVPDWETRILHNEAA